MYLTLSEANVQAEFYHQCRLIGVECILEFDTPAGRLDIAVCDKAIERLMAIVECKRQGRFVNFETKQMQRYKSIGVPIFGLNMKRNAEGLVKRIFTGISNEEFKGISFEEVMKMEVLERGSKRSRNRRSKFSNLVSQI